VRCVAFALCLLACQRSQEPARKPAGSADVADPWKAVDASVAPKKSRRERAEAALGRVNDIQPKLAKLRGLAFDHPVPTAYQTTDDFRAFLRKELAKELPPEKSAKVSAAWLHIGLLAKPVDLAKAYEQTMTSQAAAYYDPGAKKFFVVMVPESELMLDTMSAHELTHGLQDQRFDLQAFMSPKPPLDDDGAFARQFVVEGDATFAMLLYAASEGAKSDIMKGVLAKIIHGQVEQFASMDLAAYDKMMKDQAASMPDMDADLKQSMAAIGELPPAVVGPLLASYMKGAAAVLVAYDHGGWPAVDALYKNPPESSEQVLHPNTKLFPTRDHPHKIALAKLPGEELTTNTMGEILWSVYFNLWVPDQGGVQAADGWGGDRYTVVKRPDGALVAFLATTWDTPDDAKQFETAYRASLAKRFPSGGRKTAVRNAGKHVFILDGDDDAKLLDRLIRDTKIQ